MTKHVPAMLALVLCVSSAAASDVDPVFRSMASVLDMAYEMELYRVQHGRYPAAKSPAELSQVLLGTDSMTDVLVDAWGTPLHIDADPAIDRYIVASAGADRSFDREVWFRKEATKDAKADIVILRGELQRWPEEWALLRFRASGGDETRAIGNALETSKAIRTKADMMAIRTAIELHAAEHGSLPAKLPADLPQTDGWGNAFAVAIDPAARTYRIASAGSDGKFDEKRWNETGETRDFKRDAVMRDGELVTSWQTTRDAGQELDAAYAHFIVFKTKLAAIGFMHEDERRRLRLKGLDKDMDDAVERRDYFGAMNFYEEKEKLGVRDPDRLGLWALNYSLHTPPPPGQPEPPPLMADARNRAASGRITAALRRAIAATPDEQERWTMIERLSDLERERGETEVADQLLESWAEAHPRDPMPRLRLLRAAQASGDTAAMLRLGGEIMKIDPEGKDALFSTGLALYELVAKSGDALPADRKRAFAAHARQMLERAVTLDPNAMESLIYLSLTLRQQATLEPDPAKSAKLVEEANALRSKALEVSKRPR